MSQHGRATLKGLRNRAGTPLLNWDSQKCGTFRARALNAEGVCYLQPRFARATRNWAQPRSRKDSFSEGRRPSAHQAAKPLKLEGVLRNCLWGDDLVNGSHFLDQLVVLFERQSLRSVGQGFLRLIVNFD